MMNHCIGEMLVRIFRFYMKFKIFKILIWVHSIRDFCIFSTLTSLRRSAQFVDPSVSESLSILSAKLFNLFFRVIYEYKEWEILDAISRGHEPVIFRTFVTVPVEPLIFRK